MAARKKYDWDELFKQEYSLLEHGIDYQCSQSNIIQQIRNEASRRKLSVRITDMSGQVIIRVLENRREIPDTDKTAVAG